MVYNIIERVFARAVMILTLQTTTCTEYIEACKIESEQKEIWLDHCRAYHTEVNGTQKIQAAFFEKTFSSNFLLPTDSHLVGLQIVVYIIWDEIVQELLTG